MRYRPFGNSGKSVSALSLVMRHSGAMSTPLAWQNLLYTAFENGINSLEIIDGSEVMTAGLRQALGAVERRLIFLTWRVSGDPRRPLNADTLSRLLREALQRTGAGYFDLLSLDEPAYDSLTPDGHELLKDLRSAGVALQIGLTGDGPAVESVIEDPTFEVLATPFSLLSDVRTRRRVKDATLANMVAIAYDAMPPKLLQAPSAPAKAGPTLRRHAPVNPLAGAGTYAFMHSTNGWSPEDLCIGYALTEPLFATIQLDTVRPEVIERLSAVTDKDLPTGAAAQIEMARFSVEQAAQKRA